MAIGECCHPELKRLTTELKMLLSADIILPERLPTSDLFLRNEASSLSQKDLPFAKRPW